MGDMGRKRLDLPTVLLALALVAAVALLCSAAGHYQYTIWADRDFVRADVGWAELPVTGTEMNGTFQARAPGGAYYVLLHMVLAAGGGPGAVRAAMIALLLAGAAAAAHQALRLWGWRAALVAAALPLVSPTFIKQFRILWNPSVSMGLDALVCAGMLATVRGRRYGPYLFAVALAASVQVHLSALALGAAGLAAVLLHPAGGTSRRHALAATLLGLSLFTPYLLREGTDGLRLALAALQGDGGAAGAIRWSHVGQLVVMMLGTPETATGPLVPGEWLWAGRAMAGIAAAALAVAMGWRLARMGAALAAHPRRERPAPERAADAVAVTVALTLLLLLASLGARFSLDAPRYAVPLVWPVALAAGWAAERLMRRSPLMPAAAISAWLAMAAVAARAAIPEDHWDTPVRRAVLAVAEAGVPPDQVRRRVVVLGENGQARQTYADFWLRRMEAPRAGDDGACVAVMPDAGRETARTAFARLEARAAGGPATIRWWRPLGGGWAVGYDLPHGNCWRSADSPYAPYPAESAAEWACRSPASEGAAVPVAGEPGHFAARISLDRARFCLSLKVGPSSAAGTPVELNSAQLRGYSGYPSHYYALAHPRLRFLDAAGATVADVPLVEGALGGIDLPMSRGVDHDANPARPPWRVMAPPGLDAAWALRLTGALVGRRETRPVEIEVSLRQ